MRRYATEFLVIFLGVTLSFFAEDLREDRRDRQAELRSVQRVLADLEATGVAVTLTWAEDGAEAIRRIIEAQDGPLPSPEVLGQWLTTATKCGRPVINKSEYESLRSGGTIVTIEDEAFRAMLVAHYERYEPIEGIAADGCDASFMDPIAGQVETRLNEYWPVWTVVDDVDAIMSNRQFMAGLARAYAAKAFAVVRLRLLEEGRVELMAEAQRVLAQRGEDQ